MNLAVYLSGAGSNFLAIHEAFKTGRISGKLCLVISNDSAASGIAKAASLGIPTSVLERTSFESGAEFGRASLELLKRYDVDFIALAGYLRKLAPPIVRAFIGRAVNIHPALLPRFGGSGMFGIRVHEAVIEAESIESGPTVHFVDEVYDRGATIAQRRIRLNQGETPESLQSRVLELEHQLYPEVLQRLSLNFRRQS